MIKSPLRNSICMHSGKIIKLGDKVVQTFQGEVTIENFGLVINCKKETDYLLAHLNCGDKNAKK